MVNPLYMAAIFSRAELALDAVRLQTMRSIPNKLKRRIFEVAIGSMITLQPHMDIIIGEYVFDD